MRLNLDKPRELIVEVADATITVRILPTQSALELRKRHTRMKQVMGQVQEDFDQKAYAEDFWDAVIVGWTGIEDDYGQAIPCTKANKYAMVSRYTEIALKINGDIEAARAKTFEIEKEAEKN